MKSILLTGGGTGGHVIPCIALLPELRKRFDCIYYMGRSEGIEKRLAGQSGLIYLSTDTVRYDRKHFFSNLSIPTKLLTQARIAERKLKDADIDVVFAKGGYVSLPAVLGAHRARIPVVIHESDRSMGLANRLSMLYAQRVITSFPDTLSNSKSIYLGNPIRQEIMSAITSTKIRTIFDNDKPILLVIGGSSGAKALNDFVYQNILQLKADYNVILICGRSGSSEQGTGHIYIPYTERIADYMKAADYVISRAGANTANELMSMGKKVVFVPLSSSVSRGDQVENARYYEAFRGVSIINTESLSLSTLRNAMADCDREDKPIFWSRQNVNSDIADLLVGIADNRKNGKR